MSKSQHQPSPQRATRVRVSSIAVQFQTRVSGVSTAMIRRAVQAAATAYTIESLSVTVVDDCTIARLHQQFMNDPRPTDVLSFDLRDRTDDGTIEGEVVVSAETAARQARRYRATPAQEVLRYVIHGTLHLAGMDDHSAAERARMRRAENRILSELGMLAARPVKPARPSGGHKLK